MPPRRSAGGKKPCETRKPPKRLAAVLEKLPPDTVRKAEWDDALAYMEKLPAQKSAEEDRTRLLSALTGKRQGKQKQNKR